MIIRAVMLISFLVVGCNREPLPVDDTPPRTETISVDAASPDLAPARICLGGHCCMTAGGDCSDGVEDPCCDGLTCVAAGGRETCSN